MADEEVTDPQQEDAKDAAVVAAVEQVLQDAQGFTPSNRAEAVAFLAGVMGVLTDLHSIVEEVTRKSITLLGAIETSLAKSPVLAYEFIESLSEEEDEVPNGKLIIKS